MKRKWLFVNGCKCKSSFATTKGNNEYSADVGGKGFVLKNDDIL